MSELTPALLKRLLHAQDPVDIPARLVRLLAAEVLNHLETDKPEADLEDELRQRCAELLEEQRSGVMPTGKLKHYAELHHEGNIHAASRATVEEALKAAAGTYAEGCWVRRELLQHAEAAITDSINHGAPTHSNREAALQALRSTLSDIHPKEAGHQIWISRSVLLYTEAALKEAMYGRNYTQAFRDELLKELKKALAN